MHLYERLQKVEATKLLPFCMKDFLFPGVILFEET